MLIVYIILMLLLYFHLQIVLKTLSKCYDCVEKHSLEVTIGSLITEFRTERNYK